MTRVELTKTTIDEIYKVEEKYNFEKTTPNTVLLANIAMSLAGIYDLMNKKTNDISGGQDDKTASEV